MDSNNVIVCCTDTLINTSLMQYSNLHDFMHNLNFCIMCYATKITG